MAPPQTAPSMTTLSTPTRTLASAALMVAAVLARPSVAGAQAGVARDTAAQRIEPQTVKVERGGIVVGGSSVFVVSLDSARGQAAPSLADMLRAVPLMLVRTNSRGEVELSVRGSESRQVGIMMNGLPLSPGWDGRADPSLVPLTGISRVSYVRSTASVLGGPNTLGGIIDLSFAEPPRGVIAPRLALGSDQTGARLLSTSVASRIGNDTSHFSWRVGGGVRQFDGMVRADGVPDPSGERALRTNTDSRQYDFLGSLGWSHRSGGAVSAVVSGYDATRGVAPELHIAGPRYWRYPEQGRRLLQLRASAPRIHTRLGTTELEGGGGVLNGVTHIETFGDATYSTVTSTEDGREQVNSVRFAATQTLPNGVRVQAAVTGNNIMYDETIGSAAASHYRQDLLSAGVETNFLLGTRTLLSGGMVLDRGVTLSAGGRVPLGAKSITGWRLGATRELGPNARLHASASSRGRFPALRELYSGALDRFEPNPDLRPERLLATEAGVTFGDAAEPVGVNAQITAFHHRLDDGIVRTRYLATNRFQRINRDETRSMGVEALVGWSAGLGAPTVTLDVVAQRVTIRDLVAGGASRKPEYMPNLRAMLDGTIPVGRGVTLGASLANIGTQFCVNPESGNDIRLAAKTVAGVTAHRTWSLGAGAFRAMRVLAGVDNVSDAAIYEQCGLPRAGRTLRVGIDFR